MRQNQGFVDIGFLFGDWGRGEGRGEGGHIIMCHKLATSQKDKEGTQGEGYRDAGIWGCTVT